MNERRPRTNGSWLARRVRSVGYALSGLVWLIRSQANAQIHLLATICAIAVAIWLKITRIEWCAVLIMIGLVWSAEALNSALEILADHLAPNEHPLVGRAKDVAAGGVLAAAIAAVGVGIVVFGPRLVERLW
jgi:diacylglycerol kinase (ATP)